MPAYWIDSDVLIQAARDAYQFDVAPGFWEAFAENIEADNFCMPKEVEIELSERDDDVHRWVRDQRKEFIVEPSAEVQGLYAQIADYVLNGPFTQESKRGFLRKADGWLIAHARISGGVVVTRERRAGPNAQTAKIPNVCDQFGVEAIDQSELLRRLGVRLVKG